MTTKQMIWATSYNINPDFPMDRQEGIREKKLEEFKLGSINNSIDGTESEVEAQVEWWADLPEELEGLFNLNNGRFLMGVIIGRIELNEDAPEEWDEFLVDADEIDFKIQVLLTQTLVLRAVPDMPINWILRPDYLSEME